MLLINAEQFFAAFIKNNFLKLWSFFFHNPFMYIKMSFGVYHIWWAQCMWLYQCMIYSIYTYIYFFIIKLSCLFRRLGLNRCIHMDMDFLNSFSSFWCVKIWLTFNGLNIVICVAKNELMILHWHDSWKWVYEETFLICGDKLPL